MCDCQLRVPRAADACTFLGLSLIISVTHVVARIWWGPVAVLATRLLASKVPLRPISLRLVDYLLNTSDIYQQSGTSGDIERS